MMTSTAAGASYSADTGERPLLEETIGQNLRRTVAAHPAERGARRRTKRTEVVLPRAARRRRRPGPGLIRLGIGKGDRIAVWAGNSPEWTLLQYATAEIGAILVTINPAFRRHELGYVLAQSGSGCSSLPATLKARDRADDRRGPAPIARLLELVTTIGDEPWDALATTARSTPGAGRERRALLSARRPDQHPVHLRVRPGIPRAPPSPTATSSTMPTRWGCDVRLHRAGAGVRAGTAVPHVRDGAGQSGTTAHGWCVVYPAEFFDARATLVAIDQRAVHVAARGAAMFLAELGPSRPRGIRPVVPADRHDGRLSLPGRGDEAGHQPDGDRRCDDRVRDDGDLAGLDPDTRRRLLARRVGPWAGYTPMSRSRSSTPSPAPRPTRDVKASCARAGTP